MCPWKAYEDPVCMDVISVSRWFESGQISTRLGGDPPHYLLEGVEVYQSALNAARADQYDRREKARQKK